jgi:hypothetical protein
VVGGATAIHKAHGSRITPREQGRLDRWLPAAVAALGNLAAVSADLAAATFQWSAESRLCSLGACGCPPEEDTTEG